MKAFQCKICGTCCYGKGGISLKNKEIERIASFFSKPTAYFLSKFCKEKNGKVSIDIGADRYCVFHREGEGCLIHSVKPEICSRWPFFSALLKDENNWEMTKDACPGLNPDSSFEDFLKQAREEII